MLIGLTAVVQDVLILATRIHQRIGKDRHSVKGTVLVDAFGQGKNGGRKPSGVEGDGTKEIAEDVSEHLWCE